MPLGGGRPPGPAILRAAAVGWLAVACLGPGCKSPGHEGAPSSGASPAESTAAAARATDPALLLEQRVAGCPICRRMTESLPAGEFARDAHPFECAVCHHPHTRKTVAEWRATCSQSGCHPRAWPRTVFHRVDAAVFVDCMNCHAVHRWAAAGEDCKSCHDPLFGPDTVTVVRRVAGARAFSHSRHVSLECRECHSWATRHAETRLASKADCMACHHGPHSERACADCHGGPPGARDRGTTVALAFSVRPALQSRTLPFSHPRHRAFECAKCHGSGTAAAAGLCASCHDGHHRPDADCTACHRQAPASAHPLSVHEGTCSGSGCHTAPVPREGDGRNLCLVCHQGLKDHNAPGACAECHQPGGGS